MKLGILFSGGKDSNLAGFLAKKYGHRIKCLITIHSRNEESFMFHTPSISKVKKQSEMIGIPLISVNSEGKKESELEDLKKAIGLAIKKYGIKGVVTGAVESIYQASRVQKICDELGIECFNPLWQKDQIELLYDLLRYNFEIIVSGVFAYPLDKKWVGRKIDEGFIEDMIKMREEYGISPSGEGGEIETFVLRSPLFKRSLRIKNIKMSGKGNSWRGEVMLR